MKYRDAMLEAGRAYLSATLKDASGNVAEAAKVAGVHRAWMYKLMEKHGIEVTREVRCNSGADSGKAGVNRRSWHSLNR